MPLAKHYTNAPTLIRKFGCHSYISVATISMIADFRKNQKKNPWNIFLWNITGLVLLCAVVFLVIADVKMYQRRKILNTQIESLKNKIQNLQKENTTLTESMLRGDDNEYIEKIAREEFDLQQPGEKVVSFTVSQTQQQQNSEQKNIFSIWLSWLGGWFKK